MVESSDGVLRVASGTPVPDLSSAIAHAVYNGKPPTLKCIGNGAIGQAVKAAAAARGYVGPKGIDLQLVPGFFETTIKGEDMTGVILKVVVS